MPVVARERLRTIAELLEDGVNLTGISMILRLREENDQLREENRRLAGRSSEGPRSG